MYPTDLIGNKSHIGRRRI